MCGIAGSLTFGNKIISDLDVLKQFASVLKFRGPDAEGYLMESFGNCHLSFAHKRLSIIDPAPSANQPMISRSKKTIITFNGEIYNCNELRKELISNGHAFQTNSDTEVLLNGYEFWGINVLLEKIDGMFAFGLFDVIKKRLFIVRDRFGEKPVYYYLNESDCAVTFSSDIRSFNSLNLSLNVDMKSLGYFFAELSTPEEGSIWKEVKKIKPGHYAVFDNSGCKMKKFWSLDYFPKMNLRREDILDQVTLLLTKSVRYKLTSDVGYSAFLSGGIDSSLVTAIMAKSSSVPINTYTVGFDEENFDERRYARKVSEMYGTNHFELVINNPDLGTIVEILSECGEPFADSSVIASYLICKEVSKTEKVVLGGDGGDELFAGYYEHYYTDRIEKYSGLQVLKPLTGLFADFNSHIFFLNELIKDSRLPPFELLNRKGMGFANDELTRLNVEFKDASNTEHRKIWNEYSNSCPSLLDKMLSSSLHTRLVNDYLVKIDRSSMFSSLEVRSPFLDKSLAEFVSKLSHNQLLKKGITKSITKEIALKVLPPELVYRKKSGFAIPLESWIRNEFRDEILVTFNSMRTDLINKEYVLEIFNRHLNGENLTHKVWCIFVFIKWAVKNL